MFLVHENYDGTVVLPHTTNILGPSSNSPFTAYNTALYCTVRYENGFDLCVYYMCARVLRGVWYDSFIHGSFALSAGEEDQFRLNSNTITMLGIPRGEARTVLYYCSDLEEPTHYRTVDYFPRVYHPLDPKAIEAIMQKRFHTTIKVVFYRYLPVYCAVL